MVLLSCDGLYPDIETFDIEILKWKIEKNSLQSFICAFLKVYFSKIMELGCMGLNGSICDIGKRVF